MENGETKQVPALMIGYDAETQQVQLGFDPKEFKTWDFVIALLDMAKMKAEDQRRIAMMQNMERAAQEQMHAQAIRNRIMKG